MSRSRQRGLAVVEFAISGAVALTLLIGCIEIGRLLFVWNSLAESTRRAARLAAVCPANDPAIAKNAMLVAAGDGTSSSVMAGLTTANLALTYLDESGTPTATLANMRFVRAEISGYTYTMLIPSLFTPYISPMIAVPPFSTTVPVESLGYIPETGARTCMGG